jgi:RNA-directed DNA polymerase
MQESHRKGVAIHPDPESCVVAREGAIEALTGAHAGRVLSCEINRDRRADPVQQGGRPHEGRRNREPSATPRSLRPLSMHGNSCAREPGDPRLPQCRQRRTGPNLEKAMSRTSGHARRWGVGRSIVPKKRANKAGIGGGVRGGKGTDQGKRSTASDRVPDPEPDQRGSGLQGVREAAKRDKKMRFTALLHHVTVDLLRVSYYELKRRRRPESME